MTISLLSIQMGNIDLLRIKMIEILLRAAKQGFNPKFPPTLWTTLLTMLGSPSQVGVKVTCNIAGKDFSLVCVKKVFCIKVSLFKT